VQESVGQPIQLDFPNHFRGAGHGLRWHDFQGTYVHNALNAIVELFRGMHVGNGQPKAVIEDIVGRTTASTMASNWAVNFVSRS
jgi:hypothetical protein